MHVLTILAGDDNSSAGGAAFISFGILLLIPLAMYFLMIRPQRRQMRDQQSMQSTLEVGDEVLTASGIYGFITGFEDDRVWIEIDDDVQIRVNRAFVQGKVDTGGTADAPPATGTKDTPPPPLPARPASPARRSRARRARPPTPPHATNEASPPVGVAARLRRHHGRPAPLQPGVRQHAGPRPRPPGRRLRRPRPRGGGHGRRPPGHP